MGTEHSYEAAVGGRDTQNHAIVHRLESAERERRRSGVPFAAHDDGRNDEKVIAMWLHGKADSTQSKCLGEIRQFMGYVHDMLGDDVGLVLVTLRELVNYAGTLEQLAPATQIRKMAAVKSLLTFAHKIRYVEQNVGSMFQLPKADDDLDERILRHSEVERLLRAAKAGRNRTILQLLYRTGIRVGEAARLRWKHFREHRGGRVTVSVLGKGQKKRRILVDRVAWAALLELMPLDYEPERAVFPSRKGGHPLGERQIERIVKKAAKKIGLDARVSPHWLRHSHASHSLDGGAPIHVVQKQLGHSSLVTTSKYVHVAPNEGSGEYLAGGGKKAA